MPYQSIFPVSVRTQGSLLAFGRAEGPKGVWGWKRVPQGVGGLFVRILRVPQEVGGLFARALRGLLHGTLNFVGIYMTW